MGMILLVTHCVRALECATAIQEASGVLTEQSENLHDAFRRVRERDYTAVVVDQFLMDNDPEAGEQVIHHAGSAIVVPVNLAISGTERVVRELRAALRRRERELETARSAAELSIRSEMIGPLTAMLISCQIALDLPELPTVAKKKFLALQELARELCERLQVAA